MRKTVNTGKWLPALLLVLVFLPCVGLALGDYNDEAMDEYSDLWTVYYENHGPKIKMDAVLGIGAWAHGTYDRNQKDTIAKLLSSNESSATLLLEAEASFDDDIYTITIFSEYLSETPKALSLKANGRTLTSDYEFNPSYSDLHDFEFDADEMMDIIDHLLSGGKATFEITSDKGKSTAEISKAKTPKIVEMMQRTRDGRWYSHEYSDKYRSSSLLPPGKRVTPTPKPTPKVTPKPTSGVPSALQGMTFRLGDDNNKVRAIKLRMQELGYYRASASVDGRFNDMMVERLKEFQHNNWLSETGVADPRTLEEMYASNPAKGQFYVAPTPTPKPEGRYMLVIPAGGDGQWKEASGNKLQMRVQVKNESRYRTVKAFKLHIYSENIWGERDPEEGEVYYSTTIKDVKPGKTAYSDYFVLPNRREIDRVHVGVKQIRYDDGTVEEVSDYAVDYFYWTF